jgi:hypothetical protein
MMYDNGLGVAPDPVRACALMLRTTIHDASFSSALTFAAQTLAMDFNSRLAPEQMAQCMLLTDIGFDRTAQRATFTLAAGHWISVEFSSERRDAVAHIEYGGKQRDLELSGPNMAGVRYLPFTVTEVTSLRPRPEPRYFLEAFVFMPVQVNRWTLMWFVSEIVRDTLVPVTAEDLQTVDGQQPPDYELADLRRLAAVRVNADGDAEWVVLSRDDSPDRRRIHEPDGRACSPVAADHLVCPRAAAATVTGACGHAEPSHLRASRYGGQGTSACPP